MCPSGSGCLSVHRLRAGSHRHGIRFSAGAGRLQNPSNRHFTRRRQKRTTSRMIPYPALPSENASGRRIVVDRQNDRPLINGALLSSRYLIEYDRKK